MYSAQGSQELKLPADDTFYKSIFAFHKGMKQEDVRKQYYKELKNQMKLVENVRDWR